VQHGRVERAVVGDQPGQRDALQVFGHQVGPVLVDPRVEHPRGAEARHPLGGPDLAGEAHPEPGVAGQVLVHELDRDPAALGRLRKIHGAHAADAELTDEPVVVDADRVVLVQVADGGAPGRRGRAQRQVRRAGLTGFVVLACLGHRVPSRVFEGRVYTSSLVSSPGVEKTMLYASVVPVRTPFVVAVHRQHCLEQ